MSAPNLTMHVATRGLMNTNTHLSTMDRECVALLPRVCEVLADSAKSLPDDTSLEKLLDWFTGLTKTGGSLLDACPCLIEYISTVIYNRALDPAVLSFTLKLTGLVAATEGNFETLQQRLTLGQVYEQQHWQDAGLWEDPCIRIGWIQGLRSMMQHPKALHFFGMTGAINLLLQLQIDTSIFVASAAIQLLAHILLFFQPGLPGGCDGTERSREDKRTTHTCVKSPTLTEARHPALSEEYNAVMTAISEYLKKSLVPKENTQLHQSLQSLKLLALVLAQARPPLRDMLIGTVSGSLQDLVTAGYSRLTLPLMDVILAADSGSGLEESVPDQRVLCLLSSMLDINKPSDLIHAAAAVLRRGRQDTVHTARAVGIMMLPLEVITGQNLLGTHAADQHRTSMTEQLKIKASCVSLLCVCLTNAPQIALMPQDVLPCAPVSLVTALLSLLRISSGQDAPSPGHCKDVGRNVIGSGKLQKCSLDALTALCNSPGAKAKMSDVFTVLIQYLHNPDSDPTVLHKSYQALVRWASVCADVSSVAEQLRRDLLDAVKKRVCDMRWEVRDSTVEFLGQLAGVRVFPQPAEKEEEEACACEALLGCSTLSILMEALRDQESYVRASAASALAQTLRRGWQQGAALTREQTEIVSKLLDILSEDTEGFARRAVIQYFITWFTSSSSNTFPSSSSPSLLKESVRTVLSLGSADLDWEVKVHTLELAELLLDEALSGQRGYRKLSHPYASTLQTHTGPQMIGQIGEESDVSSVLDTLMEQRVISALLSGLVDCDRPVCLKACRLLITLRDTVCPPSPGATAAGAMATACKASCKLQARGWGREIRTIIGMKMRADRDDSGECDETRDESVSEGDDGDVCVSVCELLRSLDLDERLAVLTQSSDHVHNSPLSLLQDILTASAAHTRPDTQPGQEVIVDCY
ncbi:integrator complex assembly factor BRAT1 isoform X3 [Genypterus blacodes]|uniref:integrator complex assembly factor BRAT1 isoform X3 n=1 Tax=Genypterus blacodes TaxID=154954 RepID=UPI003F777088